VANAALKGDGELVRSPREKRQVEREKERERVDA